MLDHASFPSLSSGLSKRGVVSPRPTSLLNTGHGSIDDSLKIEKVQKQTLRAALDAVLANTPIATAETKAFGCTIKRKKVS